MPDPGEQLLHLLRQQLLALLASLRASLADVLAGIGPVDPPWSGTAMDGHLLARAGGTPPADPLAARVLELLDDLSTAAAGTAPTSVALYGWSPTVGGGTTAARGVAFAGRTGTRATDLAVALVLDDVSGTPTGSVVASGGTPVGAAIPLGPGWTATLSGSVAGSLTVSFTADGPPTVSGATAGDTVTLTLTRAPAPGPDVGVDGGPSLTLGAISLTAGLAVATDLAVTGTGGLTTSGGSVRLAPDGLTALVPGLGPVPLNLDLAADPTHGVTLAGATTLQVRLPAQNPLPGATIGPIDLTLAVETDGVGITVTTAIALDLPGLPLHLGMSGSGLRVPLALGAGPVVGFEPSALKPLLAAAGDVALSLPVVSGAGAVKSTGPNGYAGALVVAIPPLSASAFGILGLDPLSFLVILGASFPPPGIQIGFGFAVSGIGGIVGIGRRTDADALAAAVADGTAAGLLFPTDPAADADRIIDALPALFPAAPGRVVAGPMFQLSWGGRLISLSAALIVEVPSPVRLIVLGKLVLAMPDPLLPLVFLQVTFAGQLDLGEPSVWFLASLAGSQIVGLPLTGDAYFLTRGGDDPQFVLTIGGFHPAYSPPRGVPPLARLDMDLSPDPLLDMRAQAYFAVTSNTIQFGARIDLVAGLDVCGLRGFLGLDVLVQFDPFHFLADISAGISVRVLGETLLGIALDFSLGGPAPWHAHGRGSVDLFLFSASFEFDVQWGDPAPTPLAAPDVAGILATAFAQPSSWVASPPDLTSSPVSLSAAAHTALGAGTMVHPHGSLAGTQDRVPLGITIDHFERVPVAAQRWDIGEPLLGAGRPVAGAVEVRREFAAAAYLSMSDDEQLSSPAFQPFRAGLEFTPGGVGMQDPTPRGASLAFETSVILDEASTAPAGDWTAAGAAALLAAVSLAGAARADHPMWWQVPADRIGVSPATFLAADPWVLATAADVTPTPAASAVEAAQAVAAAVTADPTRALAVVGAWEVSA